MLDKTRIYKCRICGGWFHGDLAREMPDKDHIACYSCAHDVEEHVRKEGISIKEAFYKVKDSLWGKGFDAPGD